MSARAKVVVTDFIVEGLDHERRIRADLAILETATKNATDPEVAYDRAAIENALVELAELMDVSTPQADQQRAKAVIAKLKASSKNETLLARSAELDEALESIHSGERADELTTITTPSASFTPIPE